MSCPAVASTVVTSLLRAFELSEQVVSKFHHEALEPNSLVVLCENDIARLVPGQADAQMKLCTLVREVNAEMRHCESGERACERLLERLEMPAAAAVEVADAHNTKTAASVVKDLPAQTDTSMCAFLDGLGLGSLIHKFEDGMLDMPTLMTLTEDQLREDLMEIGVPVGARRKIALALNQHTNAAKKAAALKQAEDQMEAAAVKQHRDEAMIQTQRQEIEQLKDVIAMRGKPSEAVCPMSLDLMIDPVVAADGHSYERHILEKWLEEHDTSPLTNEVLAHKFLTPNRALRVQVQRFIEECRAAGTDPNAED